MGKLRGLKRKFEPYLLRFLLVLNNCLLFPRLNNSGTLACKFCLIIVGYPADKKNCTLTEPETQIGLIFGD